MKHAHTLMSLCVMLAMSALALSAGENTAKSRPLIGAIRWDAWYGALPETVRLPDPTRKDGNELVLICAWNELDEGGWLVPVLPPPHGEGTARLDALRKVLKPRGIEMEETTTKQVGQ